MSIRVEIERNIATREVGFYIMRDYGDGRLGVMKQVELVEEVFEAGADIAPEATFVLPYRMAQEFMEALHRALSKEGIEADSEATLKGTLSATQYHLEDMRKIVLGTKAKHA